MPSSTPPGARRAAAREGPCVSLPSTIANRRRTRHRGAASPRRVSASAAALEHGRRDRHQRAQRADGQPADEQQDVLRQHDREHVRRGGSRRLRAAPAPGAARGRCAAARPPGRWCPRARPSPPSVWNVEMIRVLDAMELGEPLGRGHHIRAEVARALFDGRRDAGRLGPAALRSAGTGSLPARERARGNSLPTSPARSASTLSASAATSRSRTVRPPRSITMSSPSRLCST